MLFSTSKLIKIARAAKELVPPKSRASLTRLINIVKSSGAKRSSSWKVSRKLAKTGLCKSRQEIRQFYDILDVVKPCGFIEQLEKNKALRLAGRTIPLSVRKKIVPSSGSFKNTCKRLQRQGKDTEKLMLLLMVATGRRFVDLTRLDATRITPRGRFRYHFMLNWDKKSNGQRVLVKVDLRAIPELWRTDDLDKVDRAFKRALDQNRRPLQGLKNKNFSRLVADFRPHSLRTLVALHLTREGLTDEKIKSVIGWRDDRSLKLYRVINREETLSCRDLDEAVAKVNFIRE